MVTVVVMVATLKIIVVELIVEALVLSNTWRSETL